MKEKEILSAITAHYDIEELNQMQKAMLARSTEKGDMILLSPTGSGKTIAFVIPLLKSFKDKPGRLQAVIIAPSRELVMQIYNVVRNIATGIKVTCCYGGHNVLDEKQSLSVTPSIIVSTPGRLLDHINRGNIDVYTTSFLVLDEFDKALELGFEDEMKKILHRMPNISRRFLTSATDIDQLPDYVRINNPIRLDFLKEKKEVEKRMNIIAVKSESKDKLDALNTLLNNIPEGRTIVFANYRESVDRIYSYLKEKGISVGVYHGGLDQIGREKAISMFNNGSYSVMLTTDLGSRGLDIAEVMNIVHYHFPVSEEIYTHRNGRTARVSASGNVYVLIGPEEKVPGYMRFEGHVELDKNATGHVKAPMASLYFQAGKKEKISRGDIVGFISNNGGIEACEIGQIDLKDHYALVAVPASKATDILNRLSPLKIKNKKVRISVAEI